MALFSIKMTSAVFPITLEGFKNDSLKAENLSDAADTNRRKLARMTSVFSRNDIRLSGGKIWAQTAGKFSWQVSALQVT